MFVNLERLSQVCQIYPEIPCKSQQLEKYSIGKYETLIEERLD